MKWLAIGAGVVVLLFAAVVYSVDSNAKQAAEQAETDRAAAAVASNLAIRQAYIDGLATCSEEDEATFNDLADKMQYKMDSTSNPYKYLMFKYLYSYVDDWADNWAYSDEEAKKMADEYVAGDVSYQ